MVLSCPIIHEIMLIYTFKNTAVHHPCGRGTRSHSGWCGRGTILRAGAGAWIPISSAEADTQPRVGRVGVARAGGVATTALGVIVEEVIIREIRAHTSNKSNQTPASRCK